MDIYVEDVASVTVVSLVGDLDGNTAPRAQAEILPLIGSGARIVLDMTGLEFMSSAGARMLLLIYRQIRASDASVILAGLHSEIEDMLGATGFLDHFEVTGTVNDGLAMFGA
jgi:anti-sigma B factor antagonist